MTYETYTNLIRVAERRLARARVVGAWGVVAEVVAEIAELKRQYCNTSKGLEK